MDFPLGYFLTWTAYGTWLPGDERGWVDGSTHEMHFAPDPGRERRARQAMVEEPVLLTTAQRDLVEATVRDHCAIRRWPLHAANARSNHVHVVVTANAPPEKPLRELKA